MVSSCDSCNRDSKEIIAEICRDMESIDEIRVVQNGLGIGSPTQAKIHGSSGSQRVEQRR